MDYRVAGYWHCGQTYTKSARYGQVLAPFSDHEYMHGALLQVNWAPVWKSGSVLEWLTDDLKEQWRDGVGVGKRKRGPDTSEGPASGDPEELSLESLLDHGVATNYDVAYLVAHIADTSSDGLHALIGTARTALTDGMHDVPAPLRGRRDPQIPGPQNQGPPNQLPLYPGYVPPGSTVAAMQPPVLFPARVQAPATAARAPRSASASASAPKRGTDAAAAAAAAA